MSATAAVTDRPRESPGLGDFYDTGSDDLFDKCARFGEFVGELRRCHLYQTQYRVVLEGPLDHRIRVRSPFTGTVDEVLCFDSNSYVGLHLHPRVVAAGAAPSRRSSGCPARWTS